MSNQLPAVEDALLALEVAEDSVLSGLADVEHLLIGGQGQSGRQRQAPQRKWPYVFPVDVDQEHAPLHEKFLTFLSSISPKTPESVK